VNTFRTILAMQWNIKGAWKSEAIRYLLGADHGVVEYLLGCSFGESRINCVHYSWGYESIS
jgi:hypothetical protein